MKTCSLQADLVKVLLHVYVFVLGKYKRVIIFERNSSI